MIETNEPRNEIFVVADFILVLLESINGLENDFEDYNFYLSCYVRVAPASSTCKDSFSSKLDIEVKTLKTLISDLYAVCCKLPLVKKTRVLKNYRFGFSDVYKEKRITQKNIYSRSILMKLEPAIAIEMIEHLN